VEVGDVPQILRSIPSIPSIQKLLRCVSQGGNGSQGSGGSGGGGGGGGYSPKKSSSEGLRIISHLSLTTLYSFPSYLMQSGGVRVCPDDGVGDQLHHIIGSQFIIGERGGGGGGEALAEVGLDGAIQVESSGCSSSSHSGSSSSSSSRSGGDEVVVERW